MSDIRHTPRHYTPEIMARINEPSLLVLFLTTGLSCFMYSWSKNIKNFRMKFVYLPIIFVSVFGVTCLVIYWTTRILNA